MLGYQQTLTVDKAISEMGLTPSSCVDYGVTTALRFLVLNEQGFGEQGYFDANRLLSYLRGIDFHRPVQEVTLPSGTELIAYRHSLLDANGKTSFGQFFTRVGEASNRLGINDEGRNFYRFCTRRDTKALESYCNSYLLNRDKPKERDYRKRVLGGGKQFIVPRARLYLEKKV